MAIVAGATMIVVASITAAIKGIINFGKKLVNLKGQADSIGTSVNGFQSMSVAAMSCGLSTERVITTISKLQGVISQAADGSDRYIKALHSIGLSWISLKRMSPEEQFAVVASQMAKIHDAGHEIPEIFRATMGDETMRVLNQAGKGFEKNLLLGRMSEGISDEAVEAAQGMVASFAKMGNAWTEWVSQMGLTTWALEQLQKVAEATAKTFREEIEISGNYSTEGTFAEETKEGIDDVSHRIQKKGDYTVEDLADLPTSKDDVFKGRILAKIDKKFNEKIIEIANEIELGGISVWKNNEDDLGIIKGKENGRIYGEYYRREMIKQLKNTPNDKLNDRQKEILRRLTEKKDSRFNYDDKSTWIQDKQNSAEKAGAMFSSDFVKEQIELQKKENELGQDSGEYIKRRDLQKELAEINKVNKKYAKMGYSQIDFSELGNNKELQALLNEAKENNRAVFKKRIEDSWKNMNLADNTTSQYYAGQGLYTASFTGNQMTAGGVIAETEIAETIRKQNDLIEKQNILKKAGVEQTEENLQIFKEEIALEQERIKKQQQMKQISAGSSTLMNAQDRLMRMKGQSRQADFLKLAREQIATQGGKPLSQEQINELNSRLDLQNLLNKDIDTSIKDNVILTNDLTSRGGMVGGAFVQDNFQSKILEKITLMSAIEQAITRQAQNVAVLQKNVQTIVGNLQGY